MKFIKKFVPVMLSLAMCASMVAPAFAANFDELQGVINNKVSLYNDDTGEVRIGYEGGTVTLNEKVERTDDEAGKSITISGKDNNVTINLNGYTIDGNDKTGSVIKVTNGASLTLTDTSDEGNGTVTGGDATFGGGVNVSDHANFTMDGGTISGNEAKHGAGVYIENGSTFTMNDGEISGNDASASGGGVFVHNYDNKDHSTFTMEGGTITENTAYEGPTGGAGGGVAAYGTKQEDAEDAVVINGGEITGNAAGGTGGGIAVQNGAMSMTGGTVSGNEAAQGGGVYIYDSNASIKGAEIKDNDATTGGGIFTSSGSNVNVTDSTITNNTATTGGGIANQSNTGVAGATITIDNSEVSNNTATKQGGGVYANNGTVNVSNSEVSDNKATADGGGVYGLNSTVDVSGSDITGNKASSGGGVAGFSSDVTIADSTIFDNTATTYGGGVYGNNSTVNLTDSNITGNKASSGGGVFSRNKTAVTMDGGTISDNISDLAGGGVYNWTGTFIMKDGTISGNKSTNNGGSGVFNYAGIFTMTGGEISGNTAKTVGGGVYNDGAGTVTLKGGVLYNNQADIAGADVVNTGTGSKLLLYRVTNSGELELLEDERSITGWYVDSNGTRWGDVYTEKVLGSTGTQFNSSIYLKAAHDEYFRVVYTDGFGTNLYETEVENNSSIPVYTGENPTLAGYTFAGWLLDGENVDWENGVVNGALTLTAVWTLNPVTPVPGGTTGGDEIEIDDQAVPLASGPVTRAEFVDYLWRHEGQPAPVADSGLFEDVTEEHELSPAMAWAKSVGLIEAYEDGTFEPDELVTVGAVRSILDNFARVFGTNAVAAADLKSLTGDEDEAVLNCDEVLAEFFGEEIEIAA